jgi:large subunit ribosomal protein L24
MSAKIKKGDQVIVITGKYKGRTGEVRRCLATGKVLVANVNIVKKHVRPNPNKGIQGGVVEKEQPIHISNVALLDAATGKPMRVGFKVLENGKKVRINKSNQEVIDV